MDISGTTTIRRIVNKARSRGQISENRDAECFQLVIDGMRDLSLFHLPAKNTVKLPIDSLGRIKLPDDYLGFIAVGIPREGRLFLFTRDNLMVQTSDKTYYYEAFDTAYGEGQDFPVEYHYGYGGPGGQNETYFSVNERLRYIQTINFTGAQATLHYVSSGISENPDGVEIPVIAEEALIAYVLWMIVAYDESSPLSSRRERERLYGEALRDLDSTRMPSVQEMADAYYSTLSQTIKRY